MQNIPEKVRIVPKTKELLFYIV